VDITGVVSGKNAYLIGFSGQHNVQGWKAAIDRGGRGGAQTLLTKAKPITPPS
jgi:hypothetical protein